VATAAGASNLHIRADAGSPVFESALRRTGSLPAVGRRLRADRDGTAFAKLPY
jgi:hypothetical protein